MPGGAQIKPNRSISRARPVVGVGYQRVGYTGSDTTTSSQPVVESYFVSPVHTGGPALLPTMARRLQVLQGHLHHLQQREEQDEAGIGKIQLSAFLAGPHLVRIRGDV